MSKQKSNHFLSSKAKEIIFNVSEAFEKEQKTGAISFLDRTAEVAGVSRSTVDSVRKEKRDAGMLSSPKKTVERGPYKPLDGYDMAAIRHKVMEFYTVRKQLPTLRNLHQELTKDIKFPGSIETLRRMMHRLGYRWKKTKDNRKVLVERPNIVALRLAFYRWKKELEDIGYEIVYTDETWRDTAYTAKKCWQGDDTPGIIYPMHRGQRIIVVHAGGRQGFIPGALLTYKAASRTGDYHSEMDGENFKKWVEERLIPNLDQPSAIVMDSASYHSMRTDKCPTISTRKADIQVYMGRAKLKPVILAAH